ncbi:hydroxymyristoyl-ACP dehydratase [Dyella tabacisoli]|uniref:Hydroxymyristoyl-ACP dehydratase n=1 Tax=Dyella tabacisoli TaxID=2282381 RepID=A0A369UR92_9GAMM|nr:hydroxymyristoyl-ACP dehydratase [Dyella tabacisoli]RDD82258.1 hydroxymyristoyl-ACP dehydratase [Dyella tabacisoli]
MNTSQYNAPLCIAADHPSLPGHFPGHPLVPGVVMLEQVAQALRAWRGLRLTGVLEAKFMAPLWPAQQAELTLTEITLNNTTDASTGERIRFEILRDGKRLARGIVSACSSVSSPSR